MMHNIYNIFIYNINYYFNIYDDLFKHYYKCKIDWVRDFLPSTVVLFSLFYLNFIILFYFI